MLLTRMAPTPSGWVHIGNLCAFYLTRLLADHLKARLLLRIDDLDVERSRDLYIEDIFRQLRWLGIEWDLGPKNLQDQKEHFSQQWNFEYYQAQLDEKRGLFPEKFFVCECSRKSRQQGRACDCRSKKLTLKTAENALMFDLRPFRGKRVSINEQMDRVFDCIFLPDADEIPIIRREGIFSYHWVSLSEDRRHQCTHIVRGQDLWQTTLLQVLMERTLYPGSEIFSKATFLHHKLLLGPDGQKLSKSESSQSVLDLRENGFSVDHFYRVFADFIGAPNEADRAPEWRRLLFSEWK